MSVLTAPRDEAASFVAKWEKQARSLIGGLLDSRDVEQLVRPLYRDVSPQVRTVDSPYAAAELIAMGELGTPRLVNDGWVNLAVPDDLVGGGTLAFDVSFTVWTVLARERSRVHAEVRDQMRWSVGMRLGIFDDMYPVYDWLSYAHPDLVTESQRSLLSVSWNLGWFWTFEDVVLVSQPPSAVDREDENAPRVQFRDGWLAVP